MFATLSSKSVKTLLLAGLSVGALAISSAKAEDGKFSDAQKQEIQKIMKEYLMENPEMITEAMNGLREKQERMAEEQAKEMIAKYEADFRSGKFPYAGNKDGDVIVVEFYDYNCGYCKKALPDVQALLKEDDNVMVVFMDMPILGPTSLTAAKWAMAAQNQGKYFEYHTELMSFQGNKDEAALTKLAEKIGLDVEKMKVDAESKEVQDRINETVTVGREIGVQGTPAFIVGDQFFRGYIGEEALIASVKEERKG